MKRLLSVPSEPELAESENNFDNERLKKIRKEFNESRYKFSKSKINEIRRSLYEIENKKNLSKSKILKIEKNLNKLEKSLFKPKKYYDDDDPEQRRIRDVENLFIQSADEDYWKPIETNSAFNSNYIEYETKGDKDKIYCMNNI